MQAAHPWRARLVVGLIMLFLAFVGMVFTNTHETGGWNYWKWMVPIYALLALWLSWYDKRQRSVVSPITLWHELLHWIGLTGVIFLVTYLVHLGTISRFIAGIFHLILLSLGVFLAGIYIDSIFLMVGIVLALFALLTALLVQYMYLLVIAITILSAVIIGVALWLKKETV